jgi:SurA N-terminal domain
MFGTFRKHQTWLWAVIITVIIFSFVIYFSPYSKMNDARRGPTNLGSINGERISEAQYFNAQNEVFLRMFFSTGHWPDEDARKQGGQVERDTYQWLLMIQEQERFGIRVSDDVAAQKAKGMLSMLQRAGVIPSPEVFIAQILPANNFKLDDFERFVRHDVGMQELVATVGLDGKLVTPQELRDLYKRENQDVATEAVFFSWSNYLASVTAPPEAISQFYSNRLAVYRLPDRVQVSYVRFDLTNYVAEANQELAAMTNLDLQIEEAYRQGGTNFLRQAKVESLAEAKVKLRDEERRRFEKQSAKKKAAEFATPLFDMEPLRAENLRTLAKEKGLTVQVTAPFDSEYGPNDLQVVGTDFAKKAFALTPEYPFAGPIDGLDSVYVIAFDKKLPSEIPALDQIRPRVVKDYEHDRAHALAVGAGMAFYPTLTNDLAQGKPFASICLNAKLKPVPVPPVSLSTRALPAVEDQVSLNQYKQLAFTTPIGRPSPFQQTSDGGLIVFVKEKLPLDEAKMNASLPAFANYVRQNRQSEAFNDWFRKVADKGLRDTPLARPPTPPSMSSATKAKKS